MSIESVMSSNHLILCHPLLLSPSIFPSIRVFSNESVLCIRWPKYWTFSFSISPSNEYSGLISFRMDWLDVLAVQGTDRQGFFLHPYTEPWQEKWIKEKVHQEHSQGADLSLEVLMFLYLVRDAGLLIEYPALFSVYPSSIKSLHQPTS